MIKVLMPTLLFCCTLLTFSAQATETPSASSSPINGLWQFTMRSSFGSVDANVTLSVEGNTLTGSFDLGDGRIWPIENGIVEGNDISFRIDRDGSLFAYEMKATIDDDRGSGVARALGIEVPWTLTRHNE